MMDTGRVVYAPVGDGFYDRLYERIEQARGADSLGPITVVVPSLYSAFFVRRSLGARGRGLFNVNFLRLDDLAERLVAADGDRPPLSHLKAAELVYSVAVDAPDDLLGPLAGLRHHPSLPPALHRAFDELRPVPPDAIERMSKEDEVAAAVIRLWRVFESRSERYSDRLAVSRMAADRLLADPGVIEAIFGRLIVAFLEEPAAPFAPLMEALAMAALAGCDGVEFVAGLTGDGAADGPILSLIERLGGNSPPSREAPAEGMRLVSVPDPSEEVQWVVRNILRLAGPGPDGGIRFGEIAVFYGNPSYAVRVDEALRAAGIPVSGPGPAPLAHHPEGRFISGLLSVFENDFSRESVMDWLTGAPVKRRSGSEVNGSRWDGISRQAGIVRGVGQWDSRLREYSARLRASAARGERYGELDEGAATAKRAEAAEADSLREFVNDMAREAPPAAGRWQDFVDWLQSHRKSYEALIRGDAGAEERVERIDGLMQELRSLDEIGGPDPDLARFTSVLHDELSSPIRATRRLGRGVLLAPVRDAVGLPLRAVHVLGMSEGSFPSPVREDPLLPERVRRVAASIGGNSVGALPTRAEREAVDRRRYLNAIASAPVRVLLWPRSEQDSGSARGPSRWFLDAARTGSRDESLQGSDLLKRSGEGWLEVVRSKEHGLLEAAGDALASRSEYTLRSMAVSAAAGMGVRGHWLAGTEDGRGLRRAAEVERLRYGRAWTAWDGNLTGEPVPAPMGGAAVSPTRLETWASCPFRYFLGSVLRLKPLAMPEELMSISPADRGSLIHAVLEEIVQRRIDAGSARPEKQQPDEQQANEDGAILEIAESLFEDYENRGLTGNRELWALEKERIRRELTRFLEEERARSDSTGFTASHTELKFGLDHDGPPAVDVSLPGGKVVTFRGAIDRVEQTDDGRVSVVDYKTGSPEPYKSMEQEPLQRGRRLQLPVYAMAVRRILGATGDVEAAYWFTSERGGFELKSISLRDVEDEAIETISRVADGIGGGIFPARPGKAVFVPDGAPGSGFENCLYCDFDRICPVNRDRMWDAKREDDAMSGYRGLVGEAGE